MKKQVIVLFFWGMVVVAACQPTQQSTEAVEKTVVTDTGLFSMRIHLEAKSADSLPDSLIQMIPGRNDVILIDPAVHLEKEHLNKIEFRKQGAGSHKVILYFNRDGTKILGQLQRNQGNGRIVVVFNNEVFDAIRMDRSFRQGHVTANRLITDEEKEKLDQSLDERLRVTQ